MKYVVVKDEYGKERCSYDVSRKEAKRLRRFYKDRPVPNKVSVVKRTR